MAEGSTPIINLHNEVLAIGINMKITVDQLFRLLSEEGHFFSVTFERRTRGRSQRPGDLRRMLCRTGVQDFKLGVISDAHRAEEDFRHGLITVFDINAFLRNRRHGVSDFDAGYNAWRRIDLCGIRELSLLDEDTLPPTIHNELHHITNPWRLAHMPITV